MKKILLLSIFVLSAVAAFAQYPAAPNKIALGRQTTGNGLVYITDSIPFWTPTTANNAWAAIDTLAKRLYAWRNGQWESVVSAGGTTIDSLAYAADTLYLYTSDGTFTTEIISSGGGVQYSDSLTVFVTPTQLSDSLAAQPQGTVTSVATGIGLTGGPITSSGTISADTATVLATKTWVNTRGFPTGVGTVNAIPKWTTTTNLGNSLLTDDGARVTVGGTAGLALPVGTTAQRSGSPVAGETRYNTTLGRAELYSGSAWQQASIGLGTATHQTLRWDGTNYVPSSAILNDDIRIRVGASAYRARATFLMVNEDTNGAPILGLNTSFSDGYFAVTADSTSRVLNGRINTGTGNNYAGGIFVGSNESNIVRKNAVIGLIGASNANAAAGENYGVYATSMSRRVAATNNGAAVGLYALAGAMHADITNMTAFAVYADAINYSTSGTKTLWGIYSNSGMNAFRQKTGIGLVTEPQDTLHVVGTARVTASGGAATTVTGRDTNGTLTDVTIGSGLSLTSGTLTAVAGGNGDVLYSDSLTIFVTPSQLSDSLAARPTLTAGSGIEIVGDSINWNGSINQNATITAGAEDLKIEFQGMVLISMEPEPELGVFRAITQSDTLLVGAGSAFIVGGDTVLIRTGAVGAIGLNADRLYFDFMNTLPIDNTKKYLVAFDSLTNQIHLIDKNTITGGGMTSFTLAGDAGTPQTVGDGETATIAGGYGVNTSAGSTRTVTVTVDTAEVASLTALADSVASVPTLYRADGTLVGDRTVTLEDKFFWLKGTGGVNYYMDSITLAAYKNSNSLSITATQTELAALNANSDLVLLAEDTIKLTSDFLQINNGGTYYTGTPPRENTHNQIFVRDSLTGQIKIMDKASIEGGGGATDLSFTGSASPVTLNSSTGTDVRFVAGTGVTLASAGDSLVINATAVQPPAVENIETTTFTALAGIINQVDCSGGAVTVNPPSTPTIGMRFAVVDATASAATNNITIDFDSANQNLYGSEQTYILNVNGAYVEFIYMGATTGWIGTKG
jgi:hypothetical protein